MRNKFEKVAAFGTVVVGAVVLFASAAFAQLPDATTIGTDTAEGIRDQFLPAMVAVIPVVLTVVVAKRIYRWARGQA